LNPLRLEDGKPTLRNWFIIQSRQTQFKKQAIRPNPHDFQIRPLEIRDQKTDILVLHIQVSKRGNPNQFFSSSAKNCDCGTFNPMNGSLKKFKLWLLKKIH
jgi:hypothetical protein